MKPALFPFIFAPLLAPALALVAPKLPAGLGPEKRQTQCSMLPCDESTAIVCSLLNCGTCEGGVCTGTATGGSEADSGSTIPDLTASLGSTGSLDLTGSGAVPSTLPIDLSALTGSGVSAGDASINIINSTSLTSSTSSMPIDLTGFEGSVSSVGSTASTGSTDSTVLTEPAGGVDST
ncbi:hypothetical protein BDW60DRAFT_205632 [Aspergillus nidulans var. acristatus]